MPNQDPKLFFSGGRGFLNVIDCNGKMTSIWGIYIQAPNQGAKGVFVFFFGILMEVFFFNDWGLCYRF
jgi:hypothetical protein